MAISSIYFNRFCRQWQVFVQAEGDYRRRADQVGQFFVKNKDVSSMLAAGLSLTPHAILVPLRNLRLVVVALALNFVAAPVFALWLYLRNLLGIFGSGAIAA